MSPIALGEIAALLASVCFAIAPTMNTLASRQVSVGTINLTRLLITVTLLTILHWIILGSPFPVQAGSGRWFWMGLSGLFGLVLGDTLLFLAFGLLGTRLTMQVTSLTPVCSVLLAWCILGEQLAWMQVVGILVTICGVFLAISGHRNSSPSPEDRQAFLKGLGLAGGAALLYAFDNISAKMGLGGDFPALSGHLIRSFVSASTFLLLILLRGRLKTTLVEFTQKPASFRYILIGAVIGPFAGMWLALLSIQKINVGIAASLASLPPIWLLPIGYYQFKEQIGPRGIAGAFLAISGVAMILLS